MAAKITVVGGGASGLAAAITAARSGASVTVIEGNAVPGKKILSTGNGRCNFTNRLQHADCYRTQSPEEAAAVLAQFGLEETLDFFQELGIHVSDRNGYLYPRSEQAAAIRDALEYGAKDAGAEFLCGERVRSLRRAADGWHLETDHGRRLLCSAVILATGGLAAPKTGSDGAGYELAKSAGHHILPTGPALTALKLAGEPALFSAWKGVRAKGTVRLLLDGEETAEDTGELQLTDYGISGIPVFQVSRYAALGLTAGNRVEAELCFLPEFSAEERKELSEAFSHSAWTAQRFLTGLLPARLVQAVLREAGVRETAPCYALKGNQKRAVMERLLAWRFRVTGTGDYASAQTTAGGVPLTEVFPDRLESRRAPGLFFAGEILDVDGICGGYNLQWAWSSGVVAGRAAAGSGAKKQRRKPGEKI